VAVGVALARPEAWPLAGGAATFQAVQHGLAKGALFLGVGVVAAAAGRRARIATLGGLAACSLALAGAPLTSGAVAKSALETPLESLEWAGAMALLSLTGAATTVLLGRFLLLAWRTSGRAGEPASVSMRGAWLALVAAALGSTWAAPALLDLPGVTSYGLSAAGVLASAWPVVLGIGLLVALVTTGLDRALPRVAPGDIALPAGAATGALTAVVRGVLATTTYLARRTARAVSETRLVRGAGGALDALESRLLDLAVAGTALLALGLAITALLLGGEPSR
jgi:NADH:ubiquinone oxidoreductase subunit 5 (subunit L)/multisubunit Na+/H+ antiporter MnhA subunit